VFLWGNTMSQPYDGQLAWREKFHMDENAVQRLGRSVIRAGVSLPFILLYAFAPKPDAATMLLSISALVLAAAGLRGLVQLKTWGVLALGAAGALTLTMVGADLRSPGAGPGLALLRRRLRQPSPSETSPSSSDHAFARVDRRGPPPCVGARGSGTRGRWRRFAGWVGLGLSGVYGGKPEKLASREEEAPRSADPRSRSRISRPGRLPWRSGRSGRRPARPRP
jgi:hypothetical protein